MMNHVQGIIHWFNIDHKILDYELDATEWNFGGNWERIDHIFHVEGL